MHSRGGRSSAVAGALAVAVTGLMLAGLPVARPVAAADAAVLIRSTGTFAWAYVPAAVQIGVGDSVTWTDQSDAGSEPHTATPDSGGFAGSPILRPGDSHTATFATAGRFTYHCDIHPSMTGVVIVAGPATTASAARPTPEPAPPTATVPPTPPAASAGPSVPGRSSPQSAPAATAGPVSTPASRTDTSAVALLVLGVVAAIGIGGLLRFVYRRGR